MLEPTDLPLRLAALERTVRLQRLALTALALALGLAGLSSWTRADPVEVRAQRFVALDDRGREVGAFGFQRTGETGSTGWNIHDPDTDSMAFCYVGSDPEESAGKDKGIAGLQLEAGWAISQHFVRELGTTISHSYIIGEDEKTAARLTAGATSSEFVLSPLPHGEDMLDERDESHALRLSYDADGPRITGNDLEGAPRISLP